MSRLTATILLAILMFPLASVLYIVVFVLRDHLWRSSSLLYPYNTAADFVLAGLLTWVFIALYWWTLWRKRVEWTPGRRWGTLRWFGLAVVLAAVAGVMGSEVNVEFGSFLASITAPLLWVFGTVLAWRESPAEHAARITSLGKEALTCPTCGYNLTGLKGTRCPECGSEFTLDQLLAGQPSRAAVELES